MKAAAEEHGCMEPQRFCEDFDCTTVHRLIVDVEDAARLLERTDEALEYGGACTCIEADLDEPIPPCPRCELQPLVATFLKEPKQ